jgi:diacylglycerol O-acyltransferase / wax synthase
VAFLPVNFALTIAAMSYNGKLDFSLLGDYDAMPDIDLIGEYVEEALEELLVAAGRPPAGPSSRGRTSRPRSSARESTVG